MDTGTLRQRKRQIEERFGQWTGFDIELAPGVSTYVSEIEKPRGELKLHEKVKHDPEQTKGYSSTYSRIRRVVQIVADLSPKPISSLRVLDLACSEGGYGIELALRGATVVGVEGREANLVKARFAAEALGLSNVEFVLDDVRNVREETYGRFDVVLCLGILYHLNAPDVFTFLSNFASMCDHMAILETHVSLKPETSRTYNGKRYWGAVFQEHDAKATEVEKQSQLWMSLDNVESFQFTRFSLINCLQHCGFASVYDCLHPTVLGYGGRTGFLAVKGSEVSTLRSSPSAPLPDEEYSEIDSGKNDSELHLLQQEVQLVRQSLDRITQHPYVRFGLAARKLLKRVQGKA